MAALSEVVVAGVVVGRSVAVWPGREKGEAVVGGPDVGENGGERGPDVCVRGDVQSAMQKLGEAAEPAWLARPGGGGLGGAAGV